MNRTIDPDEIEIENARVVLLQNEIPEAVNRAVTTRLPHGAQVILNAAPARAASSALLKRVDCLVANRLEAAEMTDCVGAADLDEMAKRLVALGPKAAIVTAGKDGALVFDGDHAERIDPPTIAQGSAHGAGDAFVGALAAEIAAGASLHDAARFASAAAAHFVQTPPEARTAISRADVANWRGRLAPSR